MPPRLLGPLGWQAGPSSSRQGHVLLSPLRGSAWPAPGSPDPAPEPWAAPPLTAEQWRGLCFLLLLHNSSAKEWFACRQLTCCRPTTQWFSLFLQDCATIPTPNSGAFLTPQN